MVWIVEKRVVHHVLGLGFEKITIPVRVTFEFEVKEGALLPDSLTTRRLYNRTILEKRYPELDLASLEHAIDTRVKKEILTYLGECGFLKEDTGSDDGP
jgi:hypothetical protein